MSECIFFVEGGRQKSKSQIIEGVGAGVVNETLNQNFPSFS